MTSLDLTTAGATALSSSLEAAAADLVDLAPVYRAAGEDTLRQAKIPRRSGFLASTAGVVVAEEGFTLVATAPYAPIVHARDPFLATAMHDQEAAILKRLDQHVTDSLDQITGA